jgi:transcriptional regulator with XRE-family HTH domain
MLYMDKRALGSKIRMLRDESGYTQEELAAKARVAHRALQRLEAGIGNPTLETLAALAASLGVPVVSFFINEDGKGFIPAEFMGAKGMKAGHRQARKSQQAKADAQMARRLPNQFTYSDANTPGEVVRAIEFVIQGKIHPEAVFAWAGAKVPLRILALYFLTGDLESLGSLSQDARTRATLLRETVLKA